MTGCSHMPNHLNCGVSASRRTFFASAVRPRRMSER